MNVIGMALRLALRMTLTDWQIDSWLRTVNRVSLYDIGHTESLIRYPHVALGKLYFV